MWWQKTGGNLQPLAMIGGIILGNVSVNKQYLYTSYGIKQYDINTEFVTVIADVQDREWIYLVVQELEAHKHY